MKTSPHSTPLFAPDPSKLSWLFGLSTIAMLLFFGSSKFEWGAFTFVGFEQFGAALSVHPDKLQLLTGVSELAVAALLFISLVIGRMRTEIALLAQLLTFGVMCAALFIEFFARTNPETTLVTVATAFAVISAIQISRLMQVSSWESEFAQSKIPTA